MFKMFKIYQYIKGLKTWQVLHSPSHHLRAKHLEGDIFHGPLGIAINNARALYGIVNLWGCKLQAEKARWR